MPPLVLYLWFLRFFFRYRFLTYCHSVTRSKDYRSPGATRVTRFDILYTKLIFGLFDRIIFYTESARDAAVALRVAPLSKAWFGNNTLDTSSIWKHYSFEVNRTQRWTIAFLGRLDARKRPELLLDYYRCLGKYLPGVRLLIIGDGPASPCIANAARLDPNIVWRGTVVDEELIARDMRNTHVVLLPGSSGLSVVHAFSYGKPFLTSPEIGFVHSPEFSYLVDGYNGMLLSGDIERDAERISGMLLDPCDYERYCRSAYKTAQDLSIEYWCERVFQALSQWPAGAQVCSSCRVRKMWKNNYG